MNKNIILLNNWLQQACLHNHEIVRWYTINSVVGSSRLQISKAPSGSTSQISSYREPATLSDLRKEVWVGEPEAICSVRRARKPSIKATSQQTQYSLRKLRRDMLDNRKCLRHAQA